MQIRARVVPEAGRYIKATKSNHKEPQMTTAGFALKSIWGRYQMTGD